MIKKEYKDVSKKEAIKIMERISQKGNLGYIKWDCELCHERVTNIEPNVFNEGGYQHTEKSDGTNCGHLSFPKKFGVFEIMKVLQEREGVKQLPNGEVELSTKLDINTVKKLDARVKQLGTTRGEFMKKTVLDYIDEEKQKGTDTLSEDFIFKTYSIPEIDRLKHYQLVKKYWDSKMRNEADVEDFIDRERSALFKALWKTSFRQSLEEAKVFVIEEDVVPMLLHTDCEDGNLPFPSVFIDARVQIKNRTYYGFHVGIYYTEKAKYRAILTAYSKLINHNGEMLRILVPDFIMLDGETDDSLINDIFSKKDFYKTKIQNLVFSFCAFINEPDVSIVNIPSNPKNNIRRQERGLLIIPDFKNVVIHGRLRVHVDRITYSHALKGRVFIHNFTFNCV